VIPVAWTSGAELGSTQKEVEENLAIWLRARLLDYAFEAKDTFIKNEQHKWRAVSALQKAIRRGHVETALRMANGLHGLDWEYVWRRMTVIALEDIGVADIPLVAAIVWVSGKRQWRVNNGGCLHYLYMLVEMMTHSVKDRSVCDLVCWADWCPDLEERRKQFFAAADAQPPHELVTLAFDNSAYLADRMLACWAIVGTKKCRGENVPERTDGSFGALMQMWASYGAVVLPMAVELICLMAANKTGDAMPVAYPLIYEMARKNWGTGLGMHWEPDGLVQMPPMGNYPSEAFDQHCREGKKALRYFSKACAPVSQFLNDCCGLEEHDTARRYLPVAILIFRVEGSQVDKRLVFDGSKDLFDLAELALNRSQLVPGNLNDYAMELVRQNMPSMHHARKIVLDMIPQGASSSPPEPVWLPTPGAWVYPKDNAPVVTKKKLIIISSGSSAN
jgi:hypothetical protein